MSGDLENSNHHAANGDKEGEEPIHPDCVLSLAKDVNINIKEMYGAIANEEGAQVDPEVISAAGDLGQTVYIELVESGKSLSTAEIEAFKTAISAFPHRPWRPHSIWKQSVEKDLEQALGDYCPTGTCKRFI